MLLFCSFSLNVLKIHAQNVSFNSTGTAPNSSAVLDLSGCTNGGFLIPCMTTAQMPSGALPTSLLIYNTTNNCFYAYFTGSASWVNCYCPCSGAPATPGAISGATSPITGSVQTYSVAAVATATSYNWTVPSGSTISTGAGTNVITVTMGSTNGNITVSATNSCGTSGTSSLAISFCSNVIVLDNQVTSGVATNTLSITTHTTNELVVIACEGYSGAFTGSVSVNQGIGAATYYNGLNVTDASVAIYWFAAPTAKTYTITVTETGYSYYDNFAVALEGFCSAPTAADFVNSNNSNITANTHSIPSSGSTNLTENANSYALGFATAYWNSTACVPTWTADDWTNGNSDGEDNYGDFGMKITSAATGSYTATYAHSINYGVMYLLNIQ
jgi:hypothetical protein